MSTPVYDLHCHTTLSDGGLTPSELVRRAHAKGVDVLAITDHDSMAAIAEAKTVIAADALPLQLINGVEITCRWQQHEIHLLGLNIDANHPALLDLLARQQQKRQQRFAEMLAKLANAGIDVSAECARIKGMPTRKHIADAMLKQGVIKSFDAAFRRFLGKGQFAYVQADWCPLEDAIEVVNAAGGDAVIAHPHAYQLSNKWLRKLIVEAKAAGLAGVEVAIGQQAPGDRAALAGFAKDYDLCASAGSDFHAPKPWRELGKNLCLPEGCVPIWSKWQQQNNNEKSVQ